MSGDQWAIEQSNHKSSPASGHPDPFNQWIDGAINTRRRRGAGQGEMRPSSIAVYRSAWRCYTRFLDDRGLTLNEVTADHLAEFLSARGSPSTRARYLHLIEKIYDSQGKGGAPEASNAPINPARTLGRKVHLSSKSRPSHIQSGESDRLADSLFASAAGASWKDMRDRAMVAVILGAGLRSHEAIRLRLHHLRLDGRGQDADEGVMINIEGGPPFRPHQTRPRPFAIIELRKWLDCRNAMSPPGDFVFIATPAGKPLHPSTLWRRVTGLMQQAGIDSTGKGARALRNAFGAGEFDRGTLEDDIQGFLGLETLEAALRLKR